MSDFFEKSIEELLQVDKKPDPKPTDITYQEYLKELEAMKDFTPPEDKMRWPKPIGPLWKN